MSPAAAATRARADRGHVTSTTTTEEDRHTRAQRQIDLIWEITQAGIALTVVGANLVAAFKLPETNALLANAFFLVIGFYFGRTNHARTGGLVPPPP